MWEGLLNNIHLCFPSPGYTLIVYVKCTTMPLDGGLGIMAAVAFSSKFVKQSQFPAWHNESFEKIPKEDVGFFEAEEYGLWHSRCGINLGRLTETNLYAVTRLLQSLDAYRSIQDQYREKEWYEAPRSKYRLCGRVREAKRNVQRNVSQEWSHVNVRFLKWDTFLIRKTTLLSIGSWELFPVCA